MRATAFAWRDNGNDSTINDSLPPAFAGLLGFVTRYPWGSALTRYTTGSMLTPAPQAVSRMAYQKWGYQIKPEIACGACISG